MSSDAWVALSSPPLDQRVVERAAATQASLAESLEEFRNHPLDDVAAATFPPKASGTSNIPSGRGVWAGRATSPLLTLLDRYRSGVTDCTEEVERTLSRLDKEEFSEVVVARLDGSATEAARQSTRRWSDGKPRPLEGIPLVVKDNIAVAGVATAAGSTRLANWKSSLTAPAVARLAELGAIVIGKSALPEWGFGDARPGSKPRNPWSPDHWTGGSSSGSAVAVARGLVPLALGTDTGGSIRVPAAYCGTVGFKPSVGCITTAGVVPVSWTLDHIGPLSRDVVDAAIGYAGICGDLTPNHHALQPRHELDHDALAGLVIGVAGGWHEQGCEPEVQAARDLAVSRLLELGAEVRPVELPCARLATTAAWIITVSEFASIHSDQRAGTHDYTDSALDRLTTGAVLSASDYIRALRIRWMLQAMYARIFERFDLLLTPGAPMAAPRLAPEPDPVFFDGERMWMQSVSRNFIGQNLIGGPALVVPAGLSARPPRPVSVQLIGEQGADDLVLSVASALAASLEGGGPAPHT